jgi:hypothetical protein
VVASGVAAPCATGVGDLAGGARLVEAQRVGDDWRRGLQDELPQCGDAGVDEWEAELAHSAGEGAVGERLAGELAGKQPARLASRGCGGKLAQQVSERIWRGASIRRTTSNAVLGSARQFTAGTSRRTVA